MRELVSAGKGLFVDKSGKGERERERGHRDRVVDAVEHAGEQV